MEMQELLGKIHFFLEFGNQFIGRKKNRKKETYIHEYRAKYT